MSVVLENKVAPSEPEEKGTVVEGNGTELSELGIQQPNKKYKIDNVLQQFGTIGRFQIVLIILMSTIAALAAWRILFDLFAAKNNFDWTCTELGKEHNCTFVDGKMPCEVDQNKAIEDKLDGVGNGLYWQFNNTGFSIKSDIPLPCKEHAKFTFTSSIFFIGAFFGVAGFGRLSDMIGRRKTLLISLGLSVSQAWVIPFFKNIYVYSACRCLDGAAFGGYFLIGFVLEVEYAPPRYRNTIGTSLHFITSIGMASISLWGYLFQDWSTYAIALAIPSSIMLPVCFFFTPESPRYCLSKGDDKQALSLLSKVAQVNKQEMPVNCELYEDVDTAASLVDVFRNRKLLRCGIINMFGWFMTSLVYYMLWFSAKNLAGSIYINALILGLAELPGRVFAFIFMEKLGRKVTFMASLALASACVMISAYNNKTSRKVMYGFGKALSGSLWAVIYLYSSEMYPTKIRSLGSGIGSASARVAALLAPFISDALTLSPVIPYIAVGVVGFLCTVAFILVPETGGKDLPQTLAEFDNLFEKKEKRNPNV